MLVHQFFFFLIYKYTMSYTCTGMCTSVADVRSCGPTQFPLFSKIKKFNTIKLLRYFSHNLKLNVRSSFSQYTRSRRFNARGVENVKRYVPFRTFDALGRGSTTKFNSTSTVRKHLFIPTIGFNIHHTCTVLNISKLKN